LDKEQLHSLLFELAAVARFRRKGTFGGFINLERFNERKASGDVLLLEDHRDYCLRQCFGSFLNALNAEWPNFSGPIAFVWDATRDAKWRQSIHGAYEPIRQSDPAKLAVISFANDRLALPLQAADMIAYRMRQKTNNRFKGESSEMSELDKALFGDANGGTIKFFN